MCKINLLLVLNVSKIITNTDTKMFMLPPPKCVRLYYHQIRAIVNAKKFPSKLWKIHRHLNLCCYVYLLLRMGNHLVMFASQFQYPFWKVDYYAAYAYHYPSEYNATLALIINNAIVFGIICQLLLYYSDVDSFAWAEMADLVVGNVDIYFNCLNTVKHISNSSFNLHNDDKLTFRPKMSFLCHTKAFNYLKTMFNYWWNFHHVDKAKLMQSSLVFFPNLNLDSRIWLLRLLDSIELYYPIFIIIYGKTGSHVSFF